MDSWIDIRRKARACHEAALSRANGNRQARALVDAALEADDLEVRHFEPGTIFGDGVLGSLDRASKLVNVAKQQDPLDELVVIAHELGHNQLHHDPQNEVTVRSAGLGGDTVDTGAGRVEGYSPRERKEIQADVFAGEFLCPADWLRDEFVTKNKRPAAVATELGLPLDLVTNQFVRALLLPPLRPPPPAAPGVAQDLDESQKVAVTWNGGPLLVDAGPGTGKTRTLVRRIEHLLASGNTPGSILALTFSIKAAEEMRERLSAMNVQAAIEMWVGTFHAFGLELLRKWPSGAGRSGKVRVLDQVGSLALLEANLQKLPLNHFQNLYEPAYELVHVLRAISRCKDELMSPEEYLSAARASLAAAATDEDKTKAEKAVEVGEIYRIYEDELCKADAVDFGDLVLLAERLVRENPEVKQYIAGFKHVLVDEYQDVNRASAKLLRAIRAQGPHVWVVADQRQSIYRFRGAEPSNVASFVAEFGGERHSLARNYRSFAPVLRTFEKFSTAMGAGGAMSGSWTAVRGDGGSVTLTVAPTLPAEAAAIRERIEELRKKGVPYSDQAILARSHLTLARLTDLLEQLGVPLLYLGDLFEREEIRDLLSLVAIDAEPGAIGLVRVSALPAYQVSRDDALALIRWAHANQIRIFEALGRAAEIDGITARGKAGLAKLAAELDGLGYASPWTMLSTWLFERSDYLRPLVLANDAPSQQKLVAIYHLLKVCGEQAAAGDSSRKRFLQHIRRIELLSQDTSYRAVASEAADAEAVRVMTIHGSKGLEFGAVHVPALATRYMPSSRQAVRCPPPASLSQLAMGQADHDAEEQCLFFVALSRARDHLSLTRAERYTSQNATASKFLPFIASVVRETRYRGPAPTITPSARLLPPPPRERYDERELSLYLQCPGRYRYERIDGLRGGPDGSGYIRFHRCVYSTVRWIEEQRSSGRPVDIAGAVSRLDQEWQTNGPVDHGFESYYRTTAEDMVKRIATAVATEVGQYEREEWPVPVGDHFVLVTPDRVLLLPDGTVHVQRIRTGRQTKSESQRPIYALLRQGAAARYPGKRVIVETFYLASGARVSIEPTDDDKLLEGYAAAIEGIERGEFVPMPDARTCPNCQSYFVCPH